MKIAAFDLDGEKRIGAVVGDNIVPLPVDMGDVIDIINGGTSELTRIQKIVDKSKSSILLKNVSLRAPIERFRRDVLCTGWNYWDHFEEGKGKREGQEVDTPKAPTFFTKSPGVVIGPYDPIAYDARISQKWDYEAEVVIVIGKKCRSVPEAEAVNVIWGYCLANDVSQRDLQRRHGGQWLKGKSIDGTMPLGPWITTADEVDLSDVELTCILNGQTVQNAGVRQMAFPIAKLVAELSFGMTLYPGDILLTGTPSGVGNAREPQLFMKDGDEVVVQATGLGELRNRLVKTDLAGNSEIRIGEAINA